MKMLVLLGTLGLCLVGMSARAPAVGCVGCTGSAPSSQTTTIGTSWVKVEVSVGSGTCVEDTIVSCTKTPCEYSTLWSWHDQTPNTNIYLCIRTDGGTRVCVDPAPTVDSTGNGNYPDSDFIKCGSTKTFTITIGTMSASANGSCSSCNHF